MVNATVACCVRAQQGTKKYTIGKAGKATKLPLPEVGCPVEFGLNGLRKEALDLHDCSGGEDKEGTSNASATGRSVAWARPLTLGLHCSKIWFCRPASPKGSLLELFKVALVAALFSEI